MIDVLKSLSDNSKLSVISVSASVNYLFSFKLRFLVLGITSDLKLYPGRFGYYVTKLQILFQCPVWCWSGGGIPRYQVGVEVPALHSAVDTCWGGCPIPVG